MQVDRLDRALETTLKSLRTQRAECALVGGLAISARVEPRFTRDIDLAVSVTGDAEALKLVRELQGSSYRIQALVEQTSLGRIATVRMFHCEEPRILVDLLFASSGIEREIVRKSESLSILGQDASVARTGHLIATKLLSESPSRPQDAVDLTRLIQVATEEDLRTARSALELIQRRGFHRGKDLLREFELRVGQLRNDPPPSGDLG